MNTSNVRSALFVPATRPDRILKAIASGADRVIVDLEDAVEERHKEQARVNLERFLVDNPRALIFVRVNAPEHWAHHADLALCKRHSAVIGVVLPKAESSIQVSAAGSANRCVWPIIETARGLSALTEIAAAEYVERLAFGSLDLGLDLNLKTGSPGAEQVLGQARYEVLLATRLANLAPALDGVFPAFQDTQGLNDCVELARDMGFGGALCIHPNQVEVIHQALKPNPEELEWARRIVELAESGQGVFVLDGQMVDAPVIGRAQSIMARA